MKRAMVPLFTVILAMAPLPALAAGLITGLTASGNPVGVNTDVTFTVKGTSGGCGDITIDFGDGQEAQLVSVSFNNNTNTTTPPHKYGVAKTYLVKAIPGKSCSGTATVSLAVTGGAGGPGGGGAASETSGKFVMGHSATAVAKATAPVIETVFLFSVISPGGGVIVKGFNFGDQPGQFKLRLQNGQETNLGSLTWNNQAVSGIIDVNITGVLDQPATLRVVNAGGSESNQVAVKFTARRELQALPMASVRAVCSQGSDSNYCNDQQGNPPRSFTSMHLCTAIGACNDSGKDIYSATLANGWALSSVSLDSTRSRVDQPVILRDEPGSFEMSLYWDTVGNVTAWYFGTIYVAGPAGTSFK